jgi:hypothetical protein
LAVDVIHQRQVVAGEPQKSPKLATHAPALAWFSRAALLTEGVAALAARYDLVLVDMFNDAEIRQPGYWPAGRLHLSADGHRRVASRVLAALGHTTVAHTVAPGPARTRSLRAEARYYREHVLPRVHRRVRGRSSGDGRAGKHPAWVTVAPH